MEYGSKICDLPCDDNYVKHVGYSESNGCIQEYYSDATRQIISRKVTELLQGVDPQNRPIIVPDKTICSVMNDIYDSFRPATGDIYSRYIVPNGMSTQSYVQSMVNQVIEVIVSNVKNTLEMEANNEKLTVWTTLYGDFNKDGLRQHPPIKTRNKRPAAMQFNMNY